MNYTAVPLPTGGFTGVPFTALIEHMYYSGACSVSARPKPGRESGCNPSVFLRVILTSLHTPQTDPDVPHVTPLCLTDPAHL